MIKPNKNQKKKDARNFNNNTATEQSRVSC